MSDDTISRKATIDAMEGVDWYHIDSDGQLTHGANSEEHEPLYKAKDVYKVLNDMPSAQPEPHWIPFKRRKPTEEEVTAFDYIMDCKCPEDGQNILVSINIQGHEPVQYDTFYGGGGEECCLESGYELVEEAIAWMPLPEPYAERRTDGIR